MRTLFVLVLAFAILFTWLLWWRAGRQPIAWQPYSRALLEQKVASGETVLVHFVADWTISVRAPQMIALETPAVRRLIARRKIVALEANMTDESEELFRMIKLLGQRSIPFVAVYSHGRLDQPLVVTEMTEANILSALGGAPSPAQ